MSERDRPNGCGVGLLILLFLVAGMAGFTLGRATAPGGSDKAATSESKDQAASPTPGAAAAAPTPAPIRDRAAEIVAQMSLDAKIYQMIFTTPESITGVSVVVQAGEATKDALAAYPVGGIIYFAHNIENREQVIDMIQNSQSFSKIPLFIGVDEEGGRVARISGNPDMGFDKIPPMAHLGASGNSSEALAVGKKLASIIGGLGFNVDFAPVADIITNPNNTEIGDRSFGDDPNVAANMVEQVVVGLQDGGVSAMLKHFPGHGSTQANSHNGYSESRRTLEEMRETEFLPFLAGINAGADFVLMSHMSAVNIDSDVPASLSKKIVTDILKTELGFSGLVITDSLSMGAVTNRYSSGEAAVMAVEAGVDVLLIPANLSGAFSGVKEAVANGRISEKRIDESVIKIISLKIKRGIMK